MTMKKQNNKKKTIETDVLVIGAGAAGLSAALTAKEQGKKVVVVERDVLGGECPNRACVPTKAMLTCAKEYDTMKNRSRSYGIHAERVTMSFKEMMTYKDAVVRTVTGNGKRLRTLLEGEGVEIVKGSARFLDPHTVCVGEKKLQAEKIIIATGVSDRVPPIAGIENIPYLFYQDVVSLKERPNLVAIVGAGPVGTELATFFSLLGVRVFIFEVAPQMLGYEDEDVAMMVQREMQEHSVRVCTNTKVLSAKKRGAKVELIFQEGRKKREQVIVDKVVMAAGKAPNIAELQIEKAAVKLDTYGHLRLNMSLQTSQKHIFAAGDVTWGMRLTNTAHRDGEIVGWNACCTGAKMKKVDNRVVPRVTFAHQEVASVGITAREARALKMIIDVRSYPIGVLGRAIAENKRTGFIKVVLEKKTQNVLGAQMVGERAGEVIHILALAMQEGIPFERLETMLYAFPTYAEAIATV